MTRPSGVVRAKAMAAGVPLPVAGSFRDAVLQEMIFREQNLKLAEVSLHTQMLELVAGFLLETADPENAKRRKVQLSESVEQALKHFEAELYQDRYTPAHQRTLREEARQQKLAALDKERQEANAVRRVAAFGEDE